MEIPFEVKARRDTGLWNAKIGIWLFLASEVMLFGGLFSGYVFLRLGAGAEPEYHWPRDVLDVTLGLINTFVLIASSVFVVFAWVQLKLRNWKMYKVWMALVVLCAGVFLVNKAFEYHAKFTHWSVRLKDESVVEGHYIHYMQVFEDVDRVTLNLLKTDYSFLDYIPKDSRAGLEFSVMKSELPEETHAAFDDFVSRQTGEAGGTYSFPLTKGVVSKLVAALNEPLRELHEKAMDQNRGDNAPLIEENRKIREQNKAIRKKNKKLRAAGVEVEEYVKLKSLKPVFNWHDGIGVTKLVLTPNEKFTVEIKRSKLRKPGNEQIEFRDYTAMTGKLSEESRYLVIDELDNLDLRSVPDPAQSLVFNYIAEHAHDGEKGGAGGKGGEHAHQTSAEIKNEFLKRRDEAMSGEQNHDEAVNLKKANVMHLDHVPIKIPWEDVKFYSNFAPKLNSYYAIYFTLTGLHGLHVLIGALVLCYFLFFSKWLYDKDPEHMANRVEVGGLFWHFVDLVWIFLFPILYLF